MLKAENVTVRFKSAPFKKDVVALNNFNVEVSKGDIFALLGPNGAGKSTAMYCFLGLIRPDKGQVTMWGEKPQPGSSQFEKIAYLPEEPHYHLYLTVEEAVKFYSSLYKKEIHSTAINNAIEQVGLGDFKKMRLNKCSKGMKQKVGIASCLISQPELVFLDEPTRGLDPLIVKEFRDILLDMSAKGTTIIVNSHILSEIEMVCNRVVIMNKGKVIVQDELKNLLHMEGDYYTVEFDQTDPLPEFLVDAKDAGGVIKAQIHMKDIYKFFDFVKKNKLQVHECSLKKMSLEDAFFDVLKGNKGNA